MKSGDSLNSLLETASFDGDDSLAEASLGGGRSLDVVARADAGAFLAAVVGQSKAVVSAIVKCSYDGRR